MSILTAKHFHDEATAFAKLESIVWPNGPVCRHCGADKRIYDLKGVRSKPSKKNPEGVERFGLKKCGACRKQFTVRVGTVFESSHIPLHKWFQAVHLLCWSKKGISSHQLHRVLEIKYQSAWFMSHRIREAMRSGGLLPPMGSGGGIVEIDETLQGFPAGRPQKKLSGRDRKSWSHHNNVLTLVERGGTARSFHVSGTTIAEIMPIIDANLSREARVVTDSAQWYKRMNDENEYASHDRVDHSKGEYVRYEPGHITVHTNTVEGFYSIFKRGMKGIYQHCSEKHLHRYLAEFDFRYNNRIALGVDDVIRAERALKGIKGKRLTYRNPDGKSA